MLIGLAVVVVRGRSMEPTLHTGDRMVILKGASPRVGRLAIVRLPPDDDGVPRPLAIKRVTMRDPADPTRYWVESDNQGLFGVADSWTHGIGSLARDQIRAVVLFRIPQRVRVPGSRRGRRATTGDEG
ncbi:MAG: S24/S26 family peptidase [Pedococcus sp.]